MVTIAGVDRSEESRRALELYRRLEFASAKVELIHVVEPFYIPGAIGVPQYEYEAAEMQRELDDEGLALLSELRPILAADSDLKVETALRHGPIGRELIARATEQRADLMIVGAAHRSLAERVMSGSVSRKLVTAAPCSVLVAKRAPVPATPLAAVFATDHSPYARRSVDLLARLRPMGIGRLTVMTACRSETIERVEAALPEAAGNARDWVMERLDAENRQVAETLSRELRCDMATRVVTGFPWQGIDAVMAETEASLLILAAQGHGAIDRLTTGSVSYHYAIDSAFSTLILRTPIEERT